MGELGKENIRYHEKFCKTPCPDPGRAGQMNIGYGHGMSAAEKKKYANGITKEEAEALLNEDVAKKEAELRGKINQDLELTRNQWNALVGLYYNLRPEKFEESDMRGYLNATPKANLDAARREMATLGWGVTRRDPKTGKPIIDPKTGKEMVDVLPGLERRRLNDIDLWDTP